MSSLLSLSITLKTLGEEDLQVLGSILCLSDLFIRVEKPTPGRDKRKVVDSGCPLVRLTRFSIKSDTMELRFAQGAMQSLQTLLIFMLSDVRETLLQFGDFVLGLENLSSLEHIHVNVRSDAKEMENVRNAVQKEIDMNQNNPKMTFPVIKVYKSGTYGRFLDVTKFSNYGELRREVGRLFGLEGELEDPLRSGWKLVLMDREGDLLLVGDEPWHEFVNVVSCIKILSPYEVEQMILY